MSVIYAHFEEKKIFIFNLFFAMAPEQVDMVLCSMGESRRRSGGGVSPTWNLTNLYYIFSTGMSLVYIRETRKRARAAVTRIFNDKSNFSLYDPAKLKQINMKLEKLETELISLNENYFMHVFSEDKDSETAMANELDSCENYNDLICECLALICTN